MRGLILQYLRCSEEYVCVEKFSKHRINNKSWFKGMYLPVSIF